MVHHLTGASLRAQQVSLTPSVNNNANHLLWEKKRLFVGCRGGMSFLSCSANMRATVNYCYATSKNAEQEARMAFCCVQTTCVGGRVSVGTEWLILVLPLSMSNQAWHRDKFQSSRDGKPLILHRSSLALVKYIQWQITSATQAVLSLSQIILL